MREYDECTRGSWHLQRPGKPDRRDMNLMHNFCIIHWRAGRKGHDYPNLF